MIVFHPAGEKGIECTDLGHCHALMQKAIWIDLFEPTEQEEIIMDMVFSVELPTRREMQDIEMSRRLYRTDEAVVMTTTILSKARTSEPESSAVTFVMAEGKLITLRYTDPQAFKTFRTEREGEPKRYDSAQRVFEGLVEAIIERLADILEKTGATLDELSHEVFRPGQGKAGAVPEKAQTRDLERVLLRLGRCSDLLSRTHESVGGLGRMLSFFIGSQKDLSAEISEHLRTLHHDLGPLGDHASFLSAKINFLLDATLGLINIEQNAIIKVFTIAAVLALPPTLVASIYGMNFHSMPELNWAIGYPFAIILMVISASGPYLYFKRRGWF